MSGRFKFGYNEAGFYVGPLKRVHRSKKKPSLACLMLHDGTLDVCLQRWIVTTHFCGRIKVRSLSKNHKGYLYVNLYRERKRGRKDKHGRRRHRMSAWVHRLVMMKKIAAESAGEGWRAVVKDIDPEIDVDHIDLNRSNNSAGNLRLIDHSHHGRRPSENWTPEDEAAVKEFNRGCPDS